jgi:hypothetical protein
MKQYNPSEKLAQAASLIQEVADVCDPDFADDLQDMAQSLECISIAIGVSALMQGESE